MTNRNTLLAAATPLLLLLLLSACAQLPPVQLRSAPTPSAADIAQLRAAQSRTLAVRREAVFPKVLDVLIDNGYLIRSASPEAGVVSFSQQWNDPSQYDANITHEGTVLFEPVDAGHTKIRVTLSGSWQRLEVSNGGARSTDTTMMSGVAQRTSVDEYKKLLDLIESGLAQ
ncbi:MAG TPA: hypothetical protein VGM81_19195 [Burkholderiaceae bacterium]|jgi:hypothetical protein